LGVDFGFKRIGLAVADEGVGLPSPRQTLTASGALKRDAAEIDRLAKKEEAGAVVIGLPVEPDGVEGRMARICRQLAGHLEELGRTVYLVDESLSSVEAEKALFESGLRASERKRKRDGEAACLILERYLNGQKTG